MKVKVYQATGQHKNYIDAWSIYFPYDKKHIDAERKRSGHLIKGVFLSCSPGVTAAQPCPRGFISCGWGDLDCTLGYSIDGLGKRVHDVPAEMQAFIDKAEPVWNEALRTDDWNEWNRI